MFWVSMGANIYGCKIMFVQTPRVGPSASQAPQPNPDQLAEVVQALSLLQSVMQQPWAQQVFQSFSPVSSEHVEAARANLHLLSLQPGL